MTKKYTILVWNDKQIKIKHIKAKNIDHASITAQKYHIKHTARPKEFDDDPRWQVWEGWAKIDIR